jgi:hypothetical protein
MHLNDDNTPSRANSSVSCGPNATRAHSIQNEFVCGKSEASRNQTLKTQAAAIRFEDPIAAIAMEVVVVPLAGSFVAGRFPRKVHRYEPTIVEKFPNRPIHGR